MAATQYLNEHEAPEKEAKQAEESYEPTPEEKKVIKLANKILDKNKKHRSMYDRTWLEDYRMFRGKQWKEARPSYRHTEVLNLVFSSIQSTVPLQTDTRPRFEFIPREPSDQEVAEIMNVVCDSDWTNRKWASELLEVIYDSNTYGTGLSTTNGKPNEVSYASADPVYCFPDPEARDTAPGEEKRCWTFVYAEPRDVAWVKRMYPDKAKFIKPDIQDLMRNEKAQDEIRFRSPADRNMVMEGTTAGDPANKDLVLYSETWISPEACQDEFDEKEEPVLDAEGNPIVGEDGKAQSQFTQIARFPKGRKICMAGNVLLSAIDAPNPYDDGEIPFERYPNYVLSREFWGMSEVEQLKGPQRIVNKIFSFALDCMTLMGNPINLIPSTSGIDPDTIINRPGANWEYDGDSPPSRLEGVGLPPFIMQLYEKCLDVYQTISGSSDVSQGVDNSGVTAAKGILALQEAARTRIRQKARNLDEYLQSVGRHYKSRVFQFYSAPKIVRLTNNENANRYFRMHIETTEDGKRSLSVVPYNDQGQEMLDEAKQFQIAGDFDIKVSTGSSLPFAKAEKDEKLRKDFQLGLIDQEEVLKNSDYTDWQQVMQRMQQAAQAAAQAEAQAAVGAPAQAGVA